MSIVQNFYEAFKQKNYQAMQACYHPEAQFTDEVFAGLNAKEVKAMWHMLILAGKDLQIVYKNVSETANGGTANWVATYTFSLTQRKVVNDVMAFFELKDGLIYRHRDHFHFYKWAAMAFGLKGSLLGWAPFFRKKIQQASREKLAAFMTKNAY